MEKRYSKLKEEVMELFGTISVEELISNKPLSNLITEIVGSLEGISIVEKYAIKERF